MVIAVIEKMNARRVYGVRVGELLSENCLRFVVAVAIGAVDSGTVKPADFAIGRGSFSQPLHKGLLGINACEILDGNFNTLHIQTIQDEVNRILSCNMRFHLR